MDLKWNLFIKFLVFSSVFLISPLQAKRVDSYNVSVNKILLVVAMDIEARPIIEKLQLQKDAHLFSDLPMQAYTGHYGNKNIFLILNGKDPMYKVDSVGTQPAVLATYLGIQYFHPDLVISIGTAGGIAENGAFTNDIYISKKIYFFDRRIGEVHAQYGLGGYRSPNFDPIIKKINVKKGIICTGNSFDLSTIDKEIILKNKCAAEEMEAGSVAWVSMLMHIPMIAIKGIGSMATSNNNHQEYTSNGANICSKLAATIKAFIQHLPA